MRVDSESIFSLESLVGALDIQHPERAFLLSLVNLGRANLTLYKKPTFCSKADEERLAISLSQGLIRLLKADW